MSDDGSFLARWSRRKSLVREGAELPDAPPAVVPAPVEPTPPAPAAVEAKPPDPSPTLDDVATLTPASDFGRFVARGVTPEVKNAALKKLFADPHYNIMDGLDTYIEDFGRPDPIPPSMLRQMAQARFLGLFDDEDESATASSDTPTPTLAPADEDADLRLQPDDAAGPARLAAGTGGEPRRED